MGGHRYRHYCDQCQLLPSQACTILAIVQKRGALGRDFWLDPSAAPCASLEPWQFQSLHPVSPHAFSTQAYSNHFLSTLVYHWFLSILLQHQNLPHLQPPVSFLIILAIFHVIPDPINSHQRFECGDCAALELDHRHQVEVHHSRQMAVAITKIIIIDCFTTTVG